jgi:hypothetical protein
MSEKGNESVGATGGSFWSGYKTLPGSRTNLDLNAAQKKHDAQALK